MSGRIDGGIQTSEALVVSRLAIREEEKRREENRLEDIANAHDDHCSPITKVKNQCSLSTHHL